MDRAMPPSLNPSNSVFCKVVNKVANQAVNVKENSTCVSLPHIFASFRTKPVD